MDLKWLSEMPEGWLSQNSVGNMSSKQADALGYVTLSFQSNLLCNSLIMRCFPSFLLPPFGAFPLTISPHPNCQTGFYMIKLITRDCMWQGEERISHICVLRIRHFLLFHEIFFLALLLISAWNAITEIINLNVVFQLTAFTSIKTYERNNLENCCITQTNAWDLKKKVHVVYKLLTLLMSFSRTLLISD